MGESKFKQFMKSVKSVTTGFADTSIGFNINQERKIEKQMAVNPDGNIAEVEVTEEENVSAAGTNVAIENHIPATSTTPPGKTVEQDVPEKEAGFLAGLTGISSDPESTQRLANNITETVTATGQTYLKILIANTGMVENALKLLSSLFGGMA